MTETTIPLPPVAFWLLVTLIGIVLASLVVVVVLPKSDTNATNTAWSRLHTRMGLGSFPESASFFAAAFWLVLALAFVGGILATIVSLPQSFTASLGDPEEASLRWTLLTLTALTGALGAVIALPFTLIRVRQTQRQTDLQDEALFNDKINAAATDLAARRQVTRVLHEGTQGECTVTEWEDDLVTRAAAIDRLEGLAKERADAAPRIARMLSIYVQELSREYPARQPPVANQRFPYAKTDDVNALNEWFEELRSKKRWDSERAVKALGRLNKPGTKTAKALSQGDIDLRQCNLQGFELIRLSFDGGVFSYARLEGAHLYFSSFVSAQLDWADLSGAHVIGVDLSHSNCFVTRFSEGLFGGTKFIGAEITRAYFPDYITQEKVRFRGASAHSAGLETIETLRNFWDQIFSDAVRYAASIAGESAVPDHWVEKSGVAPFHASWRAWAATLDPPVTIAGD